MVDVPRVCIGCAHEEGSPPVQPLPPPPPSSLSSSFARGGAGVGSLQESRGKLFATTKLDVVATVGSKELKCNVPAGCVSGMLVVIEEGVRNEESRLIVGFASILIDRPLSHTHSIGTSIAIYYNNHFAVGSNTASTTTTATAIATTSQPASVFHALHHNQRHTEVMRKTHNQHRQRESEQAPYRPSIPPTSQDIVMRRYVRV